MPNKKRSKSSKAVPFALPVFRYWVQLRDLRSGSTRDLPLSAFTRIHIPARKNQPQMPNEEVLQLGDGTTTLEARSLEDLAEQLRQRYPDDAYERTLHRERDQQAEERRADALRRLIEILAKAAVDEHFRAAKP